MLEFGQLDPVPTPLEPCIVFRKPLLGNSSEIIRESRVPGVKRHSAELYASPRSLDLPALVLSPARLLLKTDIERIDEE